MGMHGRRHSEETKRRIADAQRGRVFSEETRMKMSEKARVRAAAGKLPGPLFTSETTAGERNPFYGRRHTEETRRRLSELKLGQRHSPEARLRMSEAQRGRRHTEDTRERISLGNVLSIQSGTRTYKGTVVSPCGRSVPYRSEYELVFLRSTLEVGDVVSIVGEDGLEAVKYVLDGMSRLTVSDFMVRLRSGQVMLAECKYKSNLHRWREKARLAAQWEWCRQRGVRMLLAFNGGDYHVLRGPFVT